MNFSMITSGVTFCAAIAGFVSIRFFTIGFVIDAQWGALPRYYFLIQSFTPFLFQLFFQKSTGAEKRGDSDEGTWLENTDGDAEAVEVNIIFTTVCRGFQYIF